MIFEIGKTYTHTTGKKMTIIGRLKTHIYGECLIGELDTGELIPVGEGEDYSVNWTEQESEETETWNGIHAQITAPKGTFERIFNDADDDNDI